ncbi:hypothetical protein GUJ93_ZPchr0011g28901 [Zizania palustris]|uniref:Uncharacterized protein n=1 Tax=Zizania palustris TaxID=103762 RepID=A0A8J6BMV6_ZIZPA|nr:hypothetical protein GUJ93_ZPchr0011g28901 [Zizania palustris]
MGRTRSRSLERSVSLDTGLLIKFFLPLSIGWEKKVSPKPPAAAAGKKTTNKPEKKQEVQDEVWRKMDEFSEAICSSSTISTSSRQQQQRECPWPWWRRQQQWPWPWAHDSNPKAPTRGISRKRVGCYGGFFKPNKSKNGGTQH